MPSLQVVDTTRDKPDPTGVQDFFSRLGKDYKDKEDRVEIGKLIGEYQNNRQDANAWENLQLNLEKSNISPTKRIETQKSLNEMQKTIAAKDKAMNKGVASAGKEYAKIREKAVAEYVNEAATQGDLAQEQKFAISEARKAVAGDVTGPGFKAVLKSSPYTQMITGLTPDEASLQAANKSLLAGSKGLFGSKPTEREMFLLLNSMLPSIGKSKEANNAGLDFIEKVNDMKAARAEIVNKLTNGGSKFVDNLEQQVNEQMQPIADALLVELKEADKKYNGKEPEKKEGNKTIQVKAPDGSLWNMTQEQIDAAKKKGTIFEPVKK
jgi:hypothetical protein